LKQASTDLVHLVEVGPHPLAHDVLGDADHVRVFDAVTLDALDHLDP
jgi:hypothetical protein